MIYIYFFILYYSFKIYLFFNHLCKRFIYSTVLKEPVLEFIQQFYSLSVY